MSDVLNLGAGNRIVEGAVNHDLTKHRAEIEVAHDLDVLPWPWADGSFDKVVATSVFEHLRINLVEALDECWRLLRPGGILYVKLPHWKHDNAYLDPTHYWRYSVHTLKMFDPETGLGKRYGFYTERKWRIVKGPRLNNARSSFAATLEVRK
jgi:predicted SAM-dependent methyltransferase